MTLYAKYLFCIMIAVFIIAGGCGKKETHVPDKTDAEAELSKTEKEEPAAEKKVPEPEPEKEKDPEPADPQPEKKDGEDKNKEAEALYRKVMEYKMNGEYHKALTTSTELMSRLPKTPQAQKVIPVYHDIKKLLRAKRSCDEFYDLLRQATEIRDRYAAEKFFLQNSEVGENYLTDKLNKSSDKDFCTILGMLVKMKSGKPISFLANILLDNSRPKVQKEIYGLLSKYDQDTVRTIFLSEVEKRKKGRSQLEKLISRIEIPGLLVTLGKVYGLLGLDNNDILTDHITMACSKEGAAFFRELVLINGILEHAFDSKMIVYAQWLRKNNKDDVIKLIKQMNRKVFKASLKEGPYKKSFEKFTSRFLLLPSGVIAHYPLDGNGKDALDKNHGKAADVKPAGNKAGRAGAALHFLNTKSHIKIPHSSLLEVGKGGADFSVSFWLYLLQGPKQQWRILMHKGNNDNERTFAIWLFPTENKFHFRITTAGNASEGGDSKFKMQLKKWTHIAYVKEKNELKLYVNGTLDTAAKLTSTVKSNQGPMHIGAHMQYGTAVCIMDEVIIFNRALSVQETLSLFNAGIY